MGYDFWDIFYNIGIWLKTQELKKYEVDGVFFFQLINYLRVSLQNASL
jgi:hypothetical protein